MRTELKIGITAVLVLSVGFIVWTVFGSGISGPKIADHGPQYPAAGIGAADGNALHNVPERPPAAGAPVAAGLRSGRLGKPNAGLTGPDLLNPSYDSPPPKPATSTVRISLPGDANAVTADSNSATTKPEAAAPENETIHPKIVPVPAGHEPNRPAGETIRPQPVSPGEPARNETIRPELKPEPVRPSVTPSPSEDRIVIHPGGGGATSAPAGGEETYEIKSGDNLWKIADTHYHSADPKFQEMVRKANPGVDFDHLAVGKKIKLPPAPAAVMPANVPGPVAASGPAPELKVTPEDYGKVLQAPDGQKVYIVKKGDNGLWGIALIVYKDGALWPLLAKANPEAENGLRPGQKILIPPRESAPHPAAAERISPATTAPTTVRNAEHYVVKAGDNGLEAIAKKVYGDGALWPAIAKANPNVSSNRLKIGQELVVPFSVEDARASVGVTTRPAAGTAPSPRPAPAPPARPAGGSPSSVFD